MFAKLESYYHSIRRRLSRSEWAIRHLGLHPSEGTSEEPGLLMIQIDGLARVQLEKAIAQGRMPYLRRLLTREQHSLHTFYPGLPSTTPAVQAELYYSVRSAVPAFSFFDRQLKKIGRMWDPDWAKGRETACAEKNEGLLSGGSSWSNIYTGGASQQESHFCAASIGFGDMWRTGKIRNILVFILLQFPAALRIGWLLIVELFVAIGDAARAIAGGRRPKIELALLLSRVFVGVGLRELLVISGEIDVTRGLPIVHLNFVGYDEQAHVRGPGSLFAHYGLRRIDRSIRRIARAAHRSRRRDYAVWVFSDHGQERTRPFDAEFPGGLEAVLHRLLDGPDAVAPMAQFRSQQRAIAGTPWLSRSPRHQARLERARALDALTFEEGKSFAVAAMGPVGHIYFAAPHTDDERIAIAQRLVTEGRVPGVLVRTETQGLQWFHAKGVTRVPDEVPSVLPHPAAIAAEIANDLVQFCSIRDAGDLIVVGWSPWGEAWSFAPGERGAHGGFGPEETQGFAILPPGTVLPAGTDHFIRPAALRAAALHRLGRAKLPVTNRRKPSPAGTLRLMTYNVHGCSGMDGRVSPRRIARVIEQQGADVVALQEVDLGRRRSRAEDQASIIGEALGMHVAFCPTITVGEEHYGHAFLSRYPIEIVRRAMLPHDPRSWWPEPRSLLWVRIQGLDTPVHIVTTHLGLGVHERLLQMQMILGPECLGRVDEDEPVILCGDFNMMPGSEPYRLAVRRLRDVQLSRARRRPAATFSSMRPFLRLDHIFVSPNIEARRVEVPRNDLTRVASDHLPLVADLAILPAGAGTTTHTQR